MKQVEIKRTDAEDIREMVATGGVGGRGPASTLYPARKHMNIKGMDAQDIRKMAAAEGADAEVLRRLSSM